MEQLSKTGLVTELIAKRKDGSNFDAEILGSMTLDDRGQPIGMLASCLDVTARKRAEAGLRRANFCVQQAGDGIFWLDPEGQIVFANRKACEVLEYSSEELQAMTVFDIDPDFSQEDWETSWKSLRQNKSCVFETCHRTKTGKVFPVEINVTSITFDEIEYSCAFVRDISERKEAEKRLAHFSAIVDSSQDAIIGKTLDGVVTSWNPGAERLYGYTAAEMVGQPISTIMPPGRPDEIPSLLMKVTQGEHVEQYDTIRRRKDGGVVDVSLTLSPITNSDGEIVGISTIAHNVTNRKRAEERARLEEARAKMLLELSQMTNRSAAEIANYAMESAIKLTGSTIGHIAFTNEDETVLTMHYWSIGAMKECAVVDKPIVYQVKNTGLWGEAIRQRKPVITNNYAAPNPLKKGTPPGHVQLTRHMNIPVFDGGRIVAVAGVANKAENYEDDDVRQLTLFMDGMWRILCRKRAEESLREEKDYTQSIIRSMADMLVVVSPDGRIVTINEATCQSLGYPKHELIGQPAALLFEEEDTIQFILSEHPLSVNRPVLHRLVKEGSVSRVEKSLRTKGGERIPVFLSGAVMRDDEGEILGIVCLAFDITERKEMERRQDLSAEVLGILNDSSASSDAIDRILAAIHRATGFDAVGIRLRNGDDFPYHSQNGFSKDFLLTENTLIIRGQDGKPCRDKNGNISLECACGLVLSGQSDPAHPLFTPGGSFWTNDSFPLLDLPADQDPRLHPRNRCIHEGFRSVALIPIRANQEIIGVLQLNDRKVDSFTLDMIHFFEGISSSIGVALARKHADDALLQSKAELQQYTADLESSNYALEELSHLAESANRAKSEFLANMSHEIRTPMTAILGYADIMCEESVRRTTREHAQVIKRNGQHLLELINGILDLSKVETGKMQIEPARCSPFELLAEVVSLMRVPAEAKQLKLETDLAGALPKTVLTDPLRLRQVLVNLVGNAIKFTDHGEVRIAARLTDDSGHPRLRFDVTDTGIGMNEEQVGKLFRPFSQVDGSASRKAGGTGLGLAISKRLTEAMGGNIEVHSAPGKGSTFSVMIDPGPLDGFGMVQQGQGAAIQALIIVAPAAADKIELHGRILLAEDGPDNQRLISFLLETAGADVTATENGQLAVEVAMAARDAGQPFDVILMDMQMPVMDGYEATHTLREMGYRKPIIALTAHAMAEDRQKCLDAGCNDYATKPIDRQRLLATVAYWMARDRTNGDSPKPTTTNSKASTPIPTAFVYSHLATDPHLGELVDMFVQEMPGRISTLQAQANTRNWELLARTAHQLKGSAGSYGFHEITPCAAALEVAARDAQKEDRILAVLDELLSVCRRARSGTPPADQSVPNAPPQVV
jgi:PAS domain S-box-containing protein